MGERGEGDKFRKWKRVANFRSGPESEEAGAFFKRELENELIKKSRAFSSTPFFASMITNTPFSTFCQ